ncbi:hypothetical protein FRC03_000178 [Tulasnella sp. 419]|nr:hypothetical protein FRC02_008456 [Tulasnella sp. 418]KAG8950061.1 hypothetical protein FRC03_000178 [Tulasnella sp. 419]
MATTSCHLHLSKDTKLSSRFRIAISVIDTDAGSDTPHSIPLQITVHVPAKHDGKVDPVMEMDDKILSNAFGRHAEVGLYPPNSVLHYGGHMPTWVGSGLDRTDRRAWASLAQSIQDWLISLDVPADSREWMWGCEAFWMAYTGAYPEFPGRGDWPKWDNRVPVLGPYIENYITSRFGSSTTRVADSRELGDAHMLVDHEDLWSRLCAHIEKVTFAVRMH